MSHAFLRVHQCLLHGLLHLDQAFNDKYMIIVFTWSQILIRPRPQQHAQAMLTLTRVARFVAPNGRQQHPRVYRHPAMCGAGPASATLRPRPRCVRAWLAVYMAVS
jgi:hypothetical protein